MARAEPLDGYTRGEVEWLLSLTEKEARAIDTSPRAADLGASGNRPGAAAAASNADVPTISRWWDVRRARAIVERDVDVEPARLHGNGYTEQAIAECIGVSKSTVHRQVRAAVDAILDHLGRASVPELALSRPPACLKCGERPRTRIPVRRRRWVGERWVDRVEERMASVCWECLPPERRLLVAVARGDADEP